MGTSTFPRAVTPSGVPAIRSKRRAKLSGAWIARRALRRINRQVERALIRDDGAELARAAGRRSGAADLDRLL